MTEPNIYVNSQMNNYNNDTNQNGYKGPRKCCTFSEEFKCALKIVFCPCYIFIYNAIACFWDGRCQKEPYYTSFLFVDNIIFCILSLIDLILVIIFKDNTNTPFLVVRIISDSLGILVLWLAISLYSEEATDEDHMDPACCSCIIFENIITVGMDITSFIIFFTSNLILNVFIIISMAIHLGSFILIPILARLVPNK